MPRHNKRPVKVQKNFDNSENLDVEKHFAMSPTRGRTQEQKDYISLIKSKDLVLCNGVAGTGKTFIASSIAIDYLYSDSPINKIIITRPMVGAGEHSGFLPGGIDDKSRPYMMPIYESISEKMSEQEADRLIEELKAKNRLEVVPLEFMKGRTFKNCFAILDEAQNATAKQIKMFMTRLGLGSKMVVTGDPQQVDIPNSGFEDICEKLGDVEQIGSITLTKASIQRHPIVSIISDMI